MAPESNLPKQFGLLVYPGFEALDAFGPMEMINGLSAQQELSLAVIAATLEPVSTVMKGMHTVGQSIVPTHTFANAPDLDVLFIPGGFGGFNPAPELLDYLRKAAPKTGHIITVCNGASVAAQAGILDGKRATTNKALWSQCVAFGPKVHWVAKARWVQDGNIWTSSGVSAGIDATLAWIASIYGEETATLFANGAEFTRAPSPSDDPFSELFQCEDVPAQSTL
ncbi:DJ-1/PfpI family protein [Thozetella sp. PMI_491]|nr:DJ-1/PfpI family protein [Thozetella sp. PMI_491]